MIPPAESNSVANDDAAQWREDNVHASVTAREAEGHDFATQETFFAANQFWDHVFAASRNASADFNGAASQRILDAPRNLHGSWWAADRSWFAADGCWSFAANRSGFAAIAATAEKATGAGGRSGRDTNGNRESGKCTSKIHWKFLTGEEWIHSVTFNAVVRLGETLPSV